MTLEVRVLEGMHLVDAPAWDALFGGDDPFATHAFLSALETSRSVAPEAGFVPRHLVLTRAGRVVGALPLYLKQHSYGEYIFDFEWARAAQRSGLRYYPKLVSMVPFTPATGSRIGVLPGEDADLVTAALVEASLALAQDENASSVHFLFLHADELARVTANPAFSARRSVQYHFVDEGYGDFEGLLARFRSPARKQVRKERRTVAESGLRIELRRGHELTDADVAVVAALYERTCDRKGGTPYLEPAFFAELRRSLADSAVVCFALDADRPVAMSLSFTRGKHLYGRYWGALREVDGLHFELCYYRLIEFALAHGCTRFEAGAQGEHKIKRGFLPAVVHSAHHLRHPALARAVGAFLPREAAAVDDIIRELTELSPFRRE